jgi:hypothetical protein
MNNHTNPPAGPDTEVLRVAAKAGPKNNRVLLAFFAFSLFIAFMTKGFTKNMNTGEPIGLGVKIAGWLLILAFAAGIYWNRVFLNPEHNWLALSSEGFTFHSPSTHKQYSWPDIDSFTYGTLNRKPTVFFKFAPTYTGDRPPLSRFAPQGFEMYLPNTYGMQASDLCAHITARLMASRNS